MNESQFQELREISWRRQLTAGEEARVASYLGGRPEAADDWHSDAELNRCLAALPNAPLASNFTAQVLQELDRSIARQTKSTFWRGLPIPHWAPRIAWTALVLGLALLGYEEYQLHVRNQVAKSVVAVSQVASLPNVEIFEDFDAIHQLPPVVDDELLTALH